MGADPRPLPQRTVSKVKYEKQTLTLKSQGTSYPMYVDLDEPRTTVSQPD
jgi:hypothetical protein